MEHYVRPLDQRWLLSETTNRPDTRVLSSIQGVWLVGDISDKVVFGTNPCNFTDLSVSVPEQREKDLVQ